MPQNLNASDGKIITFLSLQLKRGQGYLSVYSISIVVVWGASVGRLVLNSTRLKQIFWEFPKIRQYTLVWFYLWMYLLECDPACLSCRLFFPIPFSNVCSIWLLWWRVKGNDRPFEDAIVPASWIMQKVQRAGPQSKLQSLSASLSPVERDYSTVGRLDRHWAGTWSNSITYN